MKRVYEKVWGQNINKKKEQSKYFLAGIIKKVEKAIKEKKQSDF